MSDTVSYDGFIGYAQLDGFKRKALEAARRTRGNALPAFGYRPVAETYGESCFLIEHETHYLAFVVEGLGTKNKVAEMMFILRRLMDRPEICGNVAQDSVAMIVNDMATSGAVPLLVGCHISVGDSKWFNHPQWNAAFIKAWKRSCDEVGAKWSGGETATLRDVVFSDTAVIGGASVGIIGPKDHRIVGDVEAGNVIHFACGTGIHANGLTQARGIAERLPDGYLTKLPDGRTFGEHLLEPTPLLPTLIAGLIERGYKPRYVVGMTGHGYRKLMRLPNPLRYVVDRPPPAQPVFRFIQKQEKLSDREMFATHNMGAVAGLIFDEDDSDGAIEVAAEIGWDLCHGGYVEDAAEREVVIPKLGITFTSQELNIR